MLSTKTLWRFGGKKSQRLVHSNVIKVEPENKNVYCENCNRKFFSRQAFSCPAGLECYVNFVENIINFFPPNSNSLSSQPEKCVGIIFYVPDSVRYGNFTLHEIPNVQYSCLNGPDIWQGENNNRSVSTVQVITISPAVTLLIFWITAITLSASPGSQCETGIIDQLEVVPLSL